VASKSRPREQKHTPERTPTRGGNADLRIARHLVIATFSPQLRAGLVEEAVAMKAPGR
jgi:hypothetical protein